MGVSTNGQICYGVLLEDGAELPWEQEEGGQDIDDWWRNQTGYVPSKPVYDGDGDRLQGITQDDIEAYYAERRKWDEAHPCPVEMVNVCSGDCPIYIVAIPSTVKSARRGYPEKIDVQADFALDPKLEIELCEFCVKYGIEYEDSPAWYLSSLWN